MDPLLLDASDPTAHHQQNNGSMKLSPNSFFDRDALANLFLGNQSPTSAGVTSSVDEWADNPGELLVELDNLSMLSQICDSVPRLPPKPSSINRSSEDGKFFFTGQSQRQLTFRDLIAFWQCYDQLYIEQYVHDRRYSSSVIDQAVQTFGLHDTDSFYSTLQQPSYRRLNSQNEYEPFFSDFPTEPSDELEACLTVTNKLVDHDPVSRLPVLSRISTMNNHSSPVPTDNELNSLVNDLDPRPTPNINDILANLKAGLIESNLQLPTFDESTLDLPRQRSSLTHNRLISSSLIDNLLVPSLFINEIEHVRLVDLSKNLLNNLPLSTIKNYAKLLQCPIVTCPEFIRDFLLRNNRQASTSRSCFCTTLSDARLIYGEIIAANVPLPATPKEDDLVLLSKKRKHAPPKGWEDGSSDMIITVPQVKRHKPKIDCSTILLDHDYLSSEHMSQLWKRTSKKPLVTIPLPVSLPLPSNEFEDELRFMESSPTPPTSAAVQPQSSTSLLSTSSSSITNLLPQSQTTTTSTAAAVQQTETRPQSPPLPPIVFKLKSYFDSQKSERPKPRFLDAYSDERFMEISQNPIIILSLTCLDYLLSYLNEPNSSSSTVDRLNLN